MEPQLLRQLADASERMAEIEARIAPQLAELDEARREVDRLKGELGLTGSRPRAAGFRGRKSRDGLMTQSDYSKRLGRSKGWAWMAARTGTLTPPAITPDGLVVPDEADRQVLERQPGSRAADAVRRLRAGVKEAPTSDEVPEQEPAAIGQAVAYLRRRGHAVTADANGYVVGTTRMRPEAVVSMARRLHPANGATDHA